MFNGLQLFLQRRSPAVEEQLLALNQRPCLIVAGKAHQGCRQFDLIGAGLFRFQPRQRGKEVFLLLMTLA